MTNLPSADEPPVWAVLAPEPDPDAPEAVVPAAEPDAAGEPAPDDAVPEPAEPEALGEPEPEEPDMELPPPGTMAGEPEVAEPEPEAAGRSAEGADVGEVD